VNTNAALGIGVLCMIWRNIRELFLKKWTNLSVG
jgi:hypothetical protein